MFFISEIITKEVMHLLLYVKFISLVYNHIVRSHDHTTILTVTLEQCLIIGVLHQA